MSAEGAPPIASAASVALACLTDEWHHIVAHEMRGRVKLGLCPAFQRFLKKCVAKGARPCTSLGCKQPVQPDSTKYFKGGCDKKCRICMKPGKQATKKAARARNAGKTPAEKTPDASVSATDAKKLERMRDEEAEPEVRSASAVEDKAMKWLVKLLERIGFDVAVTPEFRTADAAVRLLAWGADAWLPIQLKSDGPFGDDGTRKPSDSKASFGHCLGYTGMLLICIKTRIVDAAGNKAYSVWVCRGDAVTTDRLEESQSGVLAPQSIGIPRLSDPASGLAAAIVDDSLASFRRSWFSIWTEIPLWKHRKEAAIMLALRIAGFDVRIPAGNQTSIDCYLVGTLGATQVKTYMVEHRHAHACHRSKRYNNRAYHKKDKIDTLLEGVIVESGGRYYLLYAHQSAEALLEHGIFAHDGHRGLPASAGKTTISPPLDSTLRRWLRGEEGEQAERSSTAWLRAPAFGFRAPVEITEEKAREVGLPWEWVTDEAVHTAAAVPGAGPGGA